MNCIFCQIVTGQLPASFVYKDEDCTAFMDIQPVNAGHVLVIPNRHASRLAEMPERDGSQIFRVAQRIAVALQRSGIRCQGANFFLADGEAAGQEVFHVHLHVFPRFEGDGFGLKFGDRYGMKPERGELDRLAELIKDNL